MDGSSFGMRRTASAPRAGGRFRLRFTVLGVLGLGAVLSLSGCAGQSSSPAETQMPGPTPPPPEISASLLRIMTFEPYESEEQPARRQVGVDDGLRVTQEVTRRGRAAGESVLRPGDPQFRGDLGYRAEWQSDLHAEQDADFWYGASYLIPEDWNLGDNGGFFDDRIIFQFHEGTGGTPAFSLHLAEDGQRFLVRRTRPDGRFQYLWSTAFQTERWYDFSFHARWTQGEDGFFRIYLDRQLVSEYLGPTMTDGTIVYTKWGIYGQPTHVIFDEIRIARGQEALSLVTPPPAPLLP